MLKRRLLTGFGASSCEKRVHMHPHFNLPLHYLHYTFTFPLERCRQRHNGALTATGPHAQRSRVSLRNGARYRNPPPKTRRTRTARSECHLEHYANSVRTGRILLLQHTCSNQHRVPGAYRKTKPSFPRPTATLACAPAQTPKTRQHLSSAVAICLCPRVHLRPGNRRPFSWSPHSRS